VKSVEMLLVAANMFLLLVIRILRHASQFVAVDITTYERLYELSAILISFSVGFEGFWSGSL
jgi:hypothetical protein